MRYSAVVERTVFVLEVVLWDINNTVSLKLTSIIARLVDRITHTRQACSFLTHTDDFLYITNLLATAAVVAIRVYGISANNWKYLVVVGPLSLVRPVLYIVSSSRSYP